MNRNEFAAELRRMAGNNGIHFLKEDQLIQVMSDDIAAKANFINIIPSFADKNTFLLINTRSVVAVKTGMLGPKVVWSVPVAQIKSTHPARRLFRDYIVDEVRVETPSGALEFRLGFFNPHYDEHKAKLAQGNAEVAAHEVNLAINARRSAASPSPIPTAHASEQPQDALAKQLGRFIEGYSWGASAWQRNASNSGEPT